jgi:hypothetical protein
VGFKRSGLVQWQVLEKLEVLAQSGIALGIRLDGMPSRFSAGQSAARLPGILRLNVWTPACAGIHEFG